MNSRLLTTPFQKSETEIIGENYNLIISIANLCWRRKYQAVIDREDLVQIGLMTLLRVYRKYNPAQAKFCTFLYTCVKRDILKYIQSINTEIQILNTPTIEDHEKLSHYLPDLSEEEHDLIKEKLKNKTIVDIALEGGTSKRKTKLKLNKVFQKIRAANA